MIFVDTSFWAALGNATDAHHSYWAEHGRYATGAAVIG